MQFYAFGLNHKTAPLALCEAFALGAEAQRTLCEAAAPEPFELVLLSTCNRTEAYLYGTAKNVAHVQRLLSKEAGRAWPESGAFLLEDEAAVRHVLHVASGLCSMVPGDNQILTQVKSAYRRAVEAGTVDMALHRLMHTAFRAAKRVATETDLGSGAASVSTAAVAMARDHFGRGAEGDGLDGRRVLLVGAGQMGQLALEAFRSHHPAALQVTNRSPERAARLAEATGAEVVPWAERHAAAAAADLVFVATGADRPVLCAEALPAREGAAAPTLFIDIAMPRNVDPAIGEKPGYAVRDLSALHAWTRRVETRRRAARPAAEVICEELLTEFVSWVFHQEALQPAIRAIRDTFENIREQEIERHAHRFAGADRAELDALTQSILQKLLAVPIVRLKSVDPESIDYVRGIRLLSTLFSRPGCPEEEGAAETPEAGEAPEAAPRAAPVNAPARCPFETHTARSVLEDARDEALLREALRHPVFEPARS